MNICRLLFVVSLLASTPCLAQKNQRELNKKNAPRKQPSKLIECEAPTGIAVKGSWDLFASASFIYWNPSQENMELGIVSDTSDPSIFTLNGNFVDLDFDYEPGFKLGIGTNIEQDNWDLYLQYTWFRSNQNTNISLDPTGTKVLLPKWEIPDTTSPNYFAGNEEWRLRMDLLDLEFGKSICITKALSFRPFFGIRAAWIRQKVKVEYLDETTGLLLNRNIFITQSSHSWAIGPRAGIQSSWLIGKGFRWYGNASGDGLFTQYTKINIEQQATTSTGAFATSSLHNVRQEDVNYLRGHCELELGFGWGTFVSNNNSHIDLSAGYSFQIFFDQNMFRFFLDDQYLATSYMPSGNLYIHGLITTLRFDF